MTDFVIKKLPYDLSSHAGLAFIGKYLKRVNVNALIDPKFPRALWGCQQRDSQKLSRLAVFG